MGGVRVVAVGGSYWSAGEVGVVELQQPRDFFGFATQ